MTLAVLCPGQGAQHAGMFDLLRDYPAAEKILDSASVVCGDDIRSLAADEVRSHENRYAQPLICAAELATWAALRDRLPTPRVFAGYSVGELVAYGCAGALDPESVLSLALQRAEFMDSANDLPTGLAAVRGLIVAQINALAEHWQLDIAIINGGDQCVVGMPAQQLDRFCRAVEREGAKAQVLPVSVASHTHWMSRASDQFADVLHGSTMVIPAVPVLAGISGLPVYAREVAITTLSAQISTTIDWAACLETLKEYGCSAILELGPGSALSRMVQAVMPRTAIHSVADFRSLDAVVEWVGKQA